MIGARTSQGKTTLALQLAYDLASQGISVMFFSLEMTVQEMLERLFCLAYKIDNYELLTGGIHKNPEIAEKWLKFEATISSIPLLITEGLGFTFEEVNKGLAGLAEKPQVVFVDYVQAVRQSGNEREQMNEYIRRFRQICLEHGIAGVMCSQINRLAMDKSNKTREPGLEHLKGTGVLEEHADVVILLHWDYFYSSKEEDKNKYKIIVAKNRKGRTGAYEVKFFPEFYMFEDVAEEDKLTVADVEKVFQAEQQLDFDAPENPEPDSTKADE